MTGRRRSKGKVSGKFKQLTVEKKGFLLYLIMVNSCFSDAEDEKEEEDDYEVII
jgi:hypothetical protein